MSTKIFISDFFLLKKLKICCLFGFLPILLTLKVLIVKFEAESPHKLLKLAVNEQCWRKTAQTENFYDGLSYII